MNYKVTTAMLIALLILFIIACAAPEQSSMKISEQTLSVKESALERSSSNVSWQTEWNKSLSAAVKEGKVVVRALSVGPTLRQLSPYFKKKFGFDMEVTTIDRGAELVAKMTMERKAGLYIPDIIFTGTNTFFGMIRPSGLADPLEPLLLLPEVTNPDLWYGGKLPWGDKDRLLFNSYAYPNVTVAFNTELAKKEEMRSYYDLIDPRWKGKILMNDPTIAGTGIKSFSVLGFHILNLDFFRQLARQEPMIIRDQRIQVDWLAKGKYHILLFPRTAVMTEFIKAGAPIAFHLPSEGSYLTVGSVLNLASRSPHPQAARIFINWFLSKEGQSMTQAIDGVQSARLDVPTEGLDSYKIRQLGVKYFVGADTEEWVSRDPEFTKAATEIFAHLIR